MARVGADGRGARPDHDSHDRDEPRLRRELRRREVKLVTTFPPTLAALSLRLRCERLYPTPLYTTATDDPDILTSLL